VTAAGESDERTEPDPDCVPTNSLRGASEDERTAETLPPGTAATTRAPEPRAETDVVLAPGTMLGEYRIDMPVARGGMGIVYTAIHPMIGKRAAIKVLKARHCTDDAALHRFVEEARIVNEIGHPNLVDVFAFGTTPDGRSYLVMEWLVGETLAERLERVGAMSVEDTCAIVRPLASALRAAHQRGVVHRDLKPANVFLAVVPGEPPQIKLLDFGIAKLMRPRTASGPDTIEGVMLGTVTYAPPEQQRGEAIDCRVDLYALGAMMFELLVGRPPFIADTPVEVVAKHLMEPPPRLSAHVAVPREVEELVYALLAKEPAERPAIDAVIAVVERMHGRASLPRMTAPLASSPTLPMSVAVPAPVAVSVMPAPVAVPGPPKPAPAPARVALASPWRDPPAQRNLRVGPVRSAGRGQISVPRVVAAILVLVGLVLAAVWATRS
jgi:serine/threonine protein kinase